MFCIFKDEFLVLCIIYTIFTNVTNPCNIFSIFFNYLNFCLFTIFGSLKLSVENFITSTLDFTKSVIYLRDIIVSTKELFQIRLTLISNTSNCENMIALLVFSFILLFLLLPHKRDLRLKVCISTIFLFFSISHFTSKKSRSSFPENTLNNISASEFFTYESIKASNFARMFCFNQELNLVCFSNLSYQNNKTYFPFLLVLSGDISLNPGPITGSQQHNYDQWAVFIKRGLHFVHININSLPPKIDELRYIAKLSKAAVISISESKLDDSVLSSGIQIENYELIHSERNRHGGGIACFIRNDLSYNMKSFLPSEIENILTLNAPIPDKVKKLS